MAITHVDTTENAEATSGSVAVTKPTGTQANDVLVAFVAQNDQTVSASGFTELVHENGGPNSFSGTLLYKVAGGSEPSSYTFSVGSSGAPMAVVLSAWRGCSAGDPIHAFNTSGASGGSEPETGPTLTTTAETRRLDARCCRSTSSIITYSSGTSGWTERGDVGEFSGGSVRYSVGMYSRDADDSGSSLSGPSVTASDTDTDSLWLHVALNPIPTGTISFVSKADGDTGGYNTSITVNKPSGTADDDLLVAFVGGARSGGVPSGWTELGSADSGTGSLNDCYVYYKIASSEGSSYTFNLSSGDLACASILCYRGINTGAPVDTGDFEVAADSGTDYTTGTVTPSGQWWVAGAQGYEFGTDTVATWTGDGTERTDHGQAGGSPDNTSMNVRDSAGAVSTSTSVAMTRSAADDGGVRFIMLLNPGTSPTTEASAGHAAVTFTANAGTAVEGWDADAGHASVAVVANAVTSTAPLIFPGTASVSVTAYRPSLTIVNEGSVAPEGAQGALPVEHDFFDLLRGSHDVESYVEVRSPSGELRRLPVTEGDVKADRTAEVRRTFSCSLSVPDDDDLVPSHPHSLLTPWGAELTPYRGVVYPDGVEEVYPLGVFRISQVKVEDTAEGPTKITLESYDRSRTISRDKFKVPHTIDAGTNIIEAIQEIVERTYPEAEYDAIGSSQTTSAPKVYDANSDPWKACMELATSLGCEIYFDVFGRVVIAPPVDIEALPEAGFSYIEGAGNTMTDLSTQLSDEPGYNGVIVSNESPGEEQAPVRGAAWDEDPSSPTYRFGPYGEVPKFVSDDNVTTDEEAEAAALAILKDQLGFSSALDVTAVVNPAYECGDVVEVVRARSNISAFYAVDSFNVPLLGTASQSLVLRQKRTTEDFDSFG